MSLVKHIPNTITSMNLVCGILGVMCAVYGMPDYGLLCMVAAAVFDFCDGLAARLLHAYSPIGKELDSLADMVSFGVMPALLILNCMQSHGVPAWLCYSALFARTGVRNSATVRFPVMRTEFARRKVYNPRRSVQVKRGRVQTVRF